MQTANHPPLNLQIASLRAGVLVVGHGTRNKAGTDQLKKLAAQIESRLAGIPVAASFLELAEPTIEQGVSSLKARGCDRLFVVPVLLFTAAHAKSDIPDAVAEACAKHSIRVLGQTPSLGTHPRVLELSALRFEQVISSASICPVGTCAAGYDPVRRCELWQRDQNTCQLHQWHIADNRPRRSVGLAMVGRGTSDQEAIQHMKDLTKLRASMTPVRWSATGFFAGGDLTVDELLDQAEQSACDTIVVQPHLLFEGELMDKLRDKVCQRRESSSVQDWWMTASLGADPQLATVFVGLLGELVAAR